MKVVRKVIDRITEIIACLILAIMTILVTWQVITRFVLKSPSTVTEALAKYLFIWLVLVTAAYVVGKREHMSLGFFVGKFSNKTRAILGIITEFVIFAFVVIVLVYGGGYISYHAMNQMDSALPVPVGVIYLALPVGGVLSAFYSLCNIVDGILNFKRT